MSIVLNGTTGITTPDIDSAGGLDAADLTGTLPALDGSNLTGVATAAQGALAAAALQPDGDGSGLTGVGTSTAFGAVGTYTWGRPPNNTDYTEGDVVGSLRTIGQANNDKNPYHDAATWDFAVVGTNMAGSWRAMARIGKNASNQAWTGLWVRIS